MARNLSRRQFLKAAGLTTIAGVLAACTPAATTQPGSAGTTQATPAPAASTEKVSLKWDTFRAPGTGWNEERIKTFTALNPNVTIEFRGLTG
ncbi:MAG TPA: twin-arginine translocation signal domain-containing protein, partial [Anaerolineae bacterium]